MKKAFILMTCLILGDVADAATRGESAMRINPTDAVAAAVGEQNSQQQPAPQSARATRRTPTSRIKTSSPQTTVQQPALQPTTTTATQRSISSRAATPQIVTTPGRAASATVAARASSKQNVIGTGTKVTSAAQNTVVDEECWNGFNGCMDSFCMLDNANGGRCICSDKNAEYDTILEEIQKLDEQSYQLATVGVEQIEMGEAADAVIKRTKDVTKQVEKDTKDAQSKRKSLDLSQWTSTGAIDFDSDVEDIFSLSSDGVSIDNKTGDALYRAAARLCKTQLPNCANQSTMMELMYKQQIRSDCTAYENSLRQQRTQSAQKLATAQSAMREAALEQYRNANKYDLGQCTIQFKQCMQTTGGCGDDFTGCVTEQTTRQTLLDTQNDKKQKMKKIKGASTTVEITAWTYDALESKKPLCMTVTNECVNVRDQVWDTFLREVAPQVKSAELIAESNLRSSCISTITDCFQKACRDNMDPNDPEGSYDMCLTRPQTLESVCKVQIEPCKAAEPKIMDYVVARLASMRVDSCTREFKECLQSEDRCGSDYTQCVGLDTKTIVEMCPAEKLVGCQYDYSETYENSVVYSDYEGKTAKPKARVRSNEEIYDELYTIAQGVLLNIDNNMLTACQKIVQSKVVEVCGDLTFCDAFEDDDVIGTDSLLKKYTKSNGDTVISGLMNFGLINPNENGDGLVVQNESGEQTEINGEQMPNNAVDPVQQRILAAQQTIINKITQKQAVITSDEKVNQCINGRGDTWKGGETQTPTSGGKGRFPNLLNSYNLMIANSALDKAYLNYNKKYDAMVAEALKNQSNDVKQMTCAAMTWDTGGYRCNNWSKDPETGNPKCDSYTSVGDLNTLIGNLFGNGSEFNGREYTIHGANLKSKLDVLSKTGSAYIITDDYGNMLARVEKTSTFSPTTGICTIITSTTACENVEEIMEEHKQTDTYVSASLFGGGGDKHVVEWEEFKGTYCDKYAPTVTSTEEIQM